jgi:hypothetical protein
MTLHPGLDLNTQGGCSADEGNLVVAPLAGIVRATLFWNQVTPGEGNHVWVELDDPCCPGPTFFHVDHLGIISVSENQRLAPGEPIGTCSSSGGWACAHAHVELTKGSPPNGWYTWPYSWSRAQVEAAYHNPHAWWDAATALVFAEAGGVTPPSPEVITMILNGAQQAAVQAALWGDYWNPAMADFALPTAWRDEWKAGRYRGRPLSGEEDIPASEDKPAGKFQVFELGVACWLEHHPVSWNG